MYKDISLRYSKWAERFRWYYRIFAYSLKAYVKPDRVLDVGCGTGLFIDELKKVFPRSEVLGIDISPDMCSISKCVLGDALLLPFKSSTFDLVTMMFSLHDTGLKAIDEAYRVLKPGGVLAVKDVDSEMPNFAKKLMERELERNISKEYAEYVINKVNSFPDVRTILKYIEQYFKVRRVCRGIFDFDIIASKL